MSAATLANYDVAILGDMSLTGAQAAMLTSWVNGGGKLIAMHPDEQLAGLLGLTPSGSTLTNAYLVVQTSTGPGVGIVGQSMQFHGTADLYTLAGASSLATLYSSASTATTSPAVTLANAGTGQAAAFTYDLARSIVYTRQGDPAWSGQARDGQSGPIRSDDLYFGAASFDPEPDWVDLNKVAIPQADEQQRLLANLILQMNSSGKPLPRFWYFPGTSKAVVIMTGDDHGSWYSGSATSQRFSDFIAASPSGCSVADWQCVRATAYLFPQALASNPLTDSQVAAYTAQGFEVSVHVDISPTCSDWTTPALDSQYTSFLASLAAQFPSLPAPQTHRMHCISWSNYDSQPQVELNHGIRFDTSYYYWPSSWLNDQPGMFTGSGMPMRYTDRNGNIINVYQATTQMTDESGQSYPFTINTLLDNAVGVTGYYGAFVVQAHDDQGSYPGSANDIVSSAQSRGVPVVSSLQMLTWLDGRNTSSFGSLSWNSNILSFTISVGTGARNLQAMLPTTSSAGSLTSITLNGAPLSFTTQTIKGVQYAFFSASAGSYQAKYGTGNLLPDLTVTKTHTGNFSQGQTGATYTITVSNGGGGATSGTVTMTDTLPAAGLTATAISGTGWSCTLATLTCTRSDALAAAASYPAITLTVNVASNAPASVTNTATVSGGGESNTTNDTASDVTTINSPPDLTVTKTHTGNFSQGQTGATYTITVSNGGGGATSGTVTMTDTLPAAGLTATAISGTGWSCTLATLTCTRSDALAAAASYPAITLTVNVASNAPASVTNTATVSGGGESNTTNDTASNVTTINSPPDLTVTKTHTGNFSQGQTGATYTITVSNGGGGATSGTVTMTDTLPAAGLTATAISGTGWSCTLATLTCTRSDALAAAASYPAITLTVNVASNAPASVTNTATVSGGGESNTTNDTASNVTTINSPPDLTVTKTHTGNFSQGQTGATYTITVSNGGGGATSGTVTMTDTLPAAGLTATAISGTGWSCTLATLTCTRSDALAAAASYPAITLTVNVASNAPASITNTATVSGGGESNTTNDTASDVTTITAATGSTLATDAIVFKDNSAKATTVATTTFSTTSGNELLLAFISTDAPATGTNTVVNSVTGAGLTWTLVGRTNVQRGTQRSGAPSHRRHCPT